MERHAGTLIGKVRIKRQKEFKKKKKRQLNLLTMKETLIGKLRLSAGGRLVYVHFTRHTMGTGRVKHTG